jgi:hypothetical protein
LGRIWGNLRIIEGTKRGIEEQRKSKWGNGFYVIP